METCEGKLNYHEYRGMRFIFTDVTRTCFGYCVTIIRFININYTQTVQETHLSNVLYMYVYK